MPGAGLGRYSSEQNETLRKKKKAKKIEGRLVNVMSHRKQALDQVVWNPGSQAQFRQELAGWPGSDKLLLSQGHSFQ